VATDGSLSSVDPASGEPWTTWPTWPSFLPVVRELLAYAMGGQQAQWQQLVGSPLSGSIGAGSSPAGRDSDLHMVRPGGRIAPISLRSTAVGWEWNFTDTGSSGVYTLRGLPHGATQAFAVNVDTAESDLVRVDPQQLPKVVEVRRTWQGGETGLGATPESAWNQPILWGALALLFAESFMAWQFARGAV
jgi:hypothetical protein